MHNLYIGVMSGTSMDGVDIALVDLANINIDSIDKDSINAQNKNPRLIAYDCYPIPSALKAKLIILCENKVTSLQNLGELDHQLGQLFAKSINLFLANKKIDKKTITAIGCHGQTIYHSPNGDNPFTMQIGDTNIIAAKTQITTIADFRRKDMAYGGQGAPLVPAFHQAIFAEQTKNRVVVNIGGISNITVLVANQTVIGYDTGPGNLLLDGWIKKHLNLSYDQDANWAKQRIVDQSLLEQLLDESYFNLPSPKSTGRELFNLSWLMEKIAKKTLKAEDVQATLVELTAQSIANELTKLNLSRNIDCELLVCGGGAKNPLIMTRLAALLPSWQVMPTDSKGVNSDYMEAIAFAWLAYCRVNNLPSNIPAVTGASKEVSLGVIYPAD